MKMTTTEHSELNAWIDRLAERTISDAPPGDPALAPVHAARDLVVAGMRDPEWQAAVSVEQAVGLAHFVTSALDQFVTALVGLYDYKSVLALREEEAAADAIGVLGVAPRGPKVVH